MFDEKDRKKLYDSLKTREGIKRFFEKNREKLTNNRNTLETSYEQLKDSSLNEELKMLGMGTALAGMKLGEMSRDILDILEISFLHKKETQEEFKELISILKEKGEVQESKLKKLGEKLDKHDPSLEWIDNYFKRSSVTSNE